MTTVEEIVELMEGRYGRANRIWVMDRERVSEENMGLLTKEGRRYVPGTQRGQMKRYEEELLKGDWQEVQAGLEVKRVNSPDGKEVFILCRSRDRAEKERAIHDRFEQRIGEALIRTEESCEKRRYQINVMERRIGRLHVRPS